MTNSGSFMKIYSRPKSVVQITDMERLLKPERLCFDAKSSVVVRNFTVNTGVELLPIIWKGI